MKENSKIVRALWIVWGIVSAIATICGLIAFDGNTQIEYWLRTIGLILVIVCAVLFIISVIETVKYWLSFEKIVPARMQGMRGSIELLSEKDFIENNKKIIVDKMTKNCYYDTNLSTSYVTYILNCEAKQLCKKIFLSIGGGSEKNNLMIKKYYLIEKQDDYIKNSEYYSGEDNFYSEFVRESKWEITQKIDNACKIELSFEKAKKCSEKFQIVFVYEWKDAMAEKYDATSYITTMFPGGVKELNAQLIYPNSISIIQASVYKVLFKSRKKLIESPTSEEDNNKNVKIYKWNKKNPRGIYLIERGYNI